MSIKGTIYTTHAIEDDDTGAVLSETELCIHYLYSPGCEAQTYGPAENCYPAEGPEIELDYVDREEIIAGKPTWVRCGSSNKLTLWAESWLEKNVHEVIADQRDAEEFAREQAAEYRAEMRREER